MPGAQVKDEELYRDLRERGDSTEKAARLAMPRQPVRAARSRRRAAAGRPVPNGPGRTCASGPRRSASADMNDPPHRLPQHVISGAIGCLPRLSTGYSHFRARLITFAPIQSVLCREPRSREGGRAGYDRFSRRTERRQRATVTNTVTSTFGVGAFPGSVALVTVPVPGRDIGQPQQRPAGGRHHSCHYRHQPGPPARRS
jgi:hypothetical protein